MQREQHQEFLSFFFLFSPTENCILKKKIILLNRERMKKCVKKENPVASLPVLLYEANSCFC